MRWEGWGDGGGDDDDEDDAGDDNVAAADDDVADVTIATINIITITTTIALSAQSFPLTVLMKLTFRVWLHEFSHFVQSNVCVNRY